MAIGDYETFLRLLQFNLYQYNDIVSCNNLWLCLKGTIKHVKYVGPASQGGGGTCMMLIIAVGLNTQSKCTV